LTERASAAPGPSAVGGRPGLGAAVNAARRGLGLLDRVATALAYFSGVVLLLASFFITIDVVGRRFFHVSSQATDEFGGYALLFGGMLALAFALTTGAHVRIDVLMPHLPSWARAVLNYATLVAMTVFASIIAFYVWKLTIESYLIDARAMSFLRTPLFVPQGTLAVGFSLLAVHGAVILVVGFLESVRQGHLAEFDRLEMADLTEGL
jgi:TRAP-type mannitol/chloroaromatic compound transport system permease small subunit